MINDTDKLSIHLPVLFHRLVNLIVSSPNRDYASSLRERNISYCFLFSFLIFESFVWIFSSSRNYLSMNTTSCSATVVHILNRRQLEKKTVKANHRADILAYRYLQSLTQPMRSSEGHCTRTAVSSCLLPPTVKNERRRLLDEGLSCRARHWQACYRPAQTELPGNGGW